MLERLVPDGVVVVEAWHDRPGRLFPEEERALGRSVEKRRREFTTARACARDALRQLGVPPVAIAVGERGEPLWPAGVVGSITHCDGYRASAVARMREFATVGVDAEPHAPLPRGLLRDIARPEELQEMRRLRSESPDVHWDRLLFSAKESVYKAWFPLARRWLGFEDAVVAIEHRGARELCGRFTARLLVAVPPPAAHGRLQDLRGGWIVRDGIVATVIAMPREDEHSGMLAPP